MWVPLLLLLLGLRKSDWTGTWTTHRSGRSKLRKCIYIPGQHGSGAVVITLEQHATVSPEIVLVTETRVDCLLSVDWARGKHYF